MKNEHRVRCVSRLNQNRLRPPPGDWQELQIASLYCLVLPDHLGVLEPSSQEAEPCGLPEATPLLCCLCSHQALRVTLSELLIHAAARWVLHERCPVDVLDALSSTPWSPSPASQAVDPEAQSFQTHFLSPLPQFHILQAHSFGAFTEAQRPSSFQI